MFDIIKNQLFCPFCGEKQKECDFQSKDTGDLATIWTLKEIAKYFDKNDKLEIYSECSKCKEWISINLIIRKMSSFKK